MTTLSSFTRYALVGLFALAPPGAGASAAEPPPVCAGHDLGEDVDLKPALAKRADDLVNARGLLWRIDKDGLAPSYLYGTMHSADADAIALANEAAKSIADAKVVATELGAPLDSVDKAAMAGEMFAQAIDRETDTFAGVIPADASQNIDGYLSKRGFSADFAHHLKLWFLAVMTALPECEMRRAQLQLPVVDEVLAQAGKARGVPVVGLETAKEQLDIMATLPSEVAAVLLAENARFPAMSEDAFATMRRLYREKRPAEILAIMDSLPGLTPQERAAQDSFLRLMLVGRNATMAERAKPLLEAGGAFIAVGALHLAGADGLIERFRSQGYRVVNLW